MGNADEDGEVHVNAVREEYKSIATVRTLILENPYGVTLPGYRLVDWLQDTIPEGQRGWLLSVAQGIRHPGRPPLSKSGRPLEVFSGSNESGGGCSEKPAQQVLLHSTHIFSSGLGPGVKLGPRLPLEILGQSSDQDGPGLLRSDTGKGMGVCSLWTAL